MKFFLSKNDKEINRLKKYLDDLRFIVATTKSDGVREQAEEMAKNVEQEIRELTSS